MKLNHDVLKANQANVNHVNGSYRNRNLNVDRMYQESWHAHGNKSKEGS